PERPKTDVALAQAIENIAISRPTASIVYVWSPAPDPQKRAGLMEALSKHARRRTELRWVRLTLDDGFDKDATAVSLAVTSAVSLRARAAETVGERALRHLGVT